MTYTKSRSELEPHEKVGIDQLAAFGCDIETIPEIPDAPANLDIIMDGEAWEMKNVTNAGNSVENQLSRAKKKYWKMGKPGKANVVITVVDCSDDLDTVAESLRNKDGYSKIIVIGDEELERIEK